MVSRIYDQQSFSDNLTRVIQSSRVSHSVRACLLTTRDRDHAISMLKRNVKLSLYHFTVAGRHRYNPDKLEWQIVGDSSDAIALLRYAGELKGGGVVIFEDCASFLCDEGGDLRMRMTLSQMLSSENENEGLVLIFMESPGTENKLPSILADQFIRLAVPYPRAGELESIAREEITRAQHQAGEMMDVSVIKAEAKRLSSGLVGLTRSAARDTLRDALVPDPQDFDAAYGYLQERKTVQLRRELAMNVLDTVDEESPIGLDFLVEYLLVRKDNMTRSERFDAAFFVDVPSFESRRRMLERWLAERMPDYVEAAQELAAMTEKFSGADLRSVVKQAIARAEYADSKELTMDILKSEIERKRLRAISIYDEFDELRRWGRKYCEPAGPTDG